MIFIGTDASEKITGTIGDDFLSGLGGRDTIKGGEGDDTISGGGGNDRLIGNSGFDTIDYSATSAGVKLDLHFGTAKFIGESWKPETVLLFEAAIGTDYGDKIYGTHGDNEIFSGLGEDYIHGRRGDDLLVADGQFSTLRGGGGDDTLDGGLSSTLRGGGGDDVLIYDEKGYGSNMQGGSGADTFRIQREADTYHGIIESGSWITIGDFNPDEGDRIELFGEDWFQNGETFVGSVDEVPHLWGNQWGFSVGDSGTVIYHQNTTSGDSYWANHIELVDYYGAVDADTLIFL